MSILENHTHLFASTPILLTALDNEKMQRIIHAIETVIDLPQYQDYVLKQAPTIAQFNFRSQGGLLSYDFHLTAEGPKLIEINTNAGGLLLNTLLLKEHKQQSNKAVIDSAMIDAQLLEMFLNEWHLQRDDKPLRSIAIVDQKPTMQFLYPEFLLFQQLLVRNGINTIIADPAELRIRERTLYYHDVAIDLVYNRLTDFYLSESTHEVIYIAYKEDIAVVTPHPRAYALYADKRNLVILADTELLQSWQVTESTLSTLRSGIPKAFMVDPQHAQLLWENRSKYFFKPIWGYAGKGSYRGEKLTKRVFAEILKNHYLAQEFVPPTEQLILQQEKVISLKIDFRNYVYNKEKILLAARLYQGQTTNFRTPGGGFACVLLTNN